MIGANIGKFLNDVAALVETKKTTDIVDISNQSSKEGIRIVIGTQERMQTSRHLINMLYKKTRLEDTFGVNMLAVADGRPETLELEADHRAIMSISSLKCNRRKVYRHCWQKSRKSRRFRKV